ncbi:Myb-like_DNA-binding domain-containing protein [Hexamita inflata]|uniref:Myb-like DNA-binding domain-containing protein n=1 Tax=Hexamita inflata TaxID=28002 RepID=A0AA86NII6_9EUKA|nr:Myb-like DNA-binding domain-containing protein [Hexamita inflata]CAI9947490.1 Myb-like DNA-binding domain-containing protein [Hexamita inflata]
MSKKPWNKAEITQLTLLTEPYRTNNTNVNWVHVSQQIQSRTASQCQSYYANILKKQLNVEIRKNHRWNYIEILALWTCAVIYNQDFTLIRKNFMPRFSSKQLSSQYLQILKKQKQIYKVFKEIIQNPQLIQLLSDNDFKLHLQILLIASKRQRILDAISSYRQIKEESKYDADISEKAAIKAFFLDLDFEILLLIYKTENKRRKMDENYSVPEVEVNFTE